MNKERLKHFTDSITLEKNIKYKCEKLDRDKIRVRFYKTATTFLSFILVYLLLNKNNTLKS